MSANHVVFNTKAFSFRCHHCGAELAAPPPPAALSEVVAMSQRFLKDHRRCVKHPATQTQESA